MFPQAVDTSNFAWVSTFAYAVGDPVLYNNQWWLSLQAANIGNIPSENAFWTLVNKVSNFGLRRWIAGLYINDDEFVVHNGILYELNASPTPTRPFNSINDPSVDVTNWTALSGGVSVEHEKYYVSPDLDNIIIAKYRTPVQLIVKFFNGVTALTYRSKLDDGIDTYTARASIGALNTYLAGLANNIDVDIEMTSDATKLTVVRIEINRT